MDPTATIEAPAARILSRPSKAAWWTGWVLTVLFGLFLLVDAGMKFAKPAFVVEETVKLGFAESVIVPLGVVLLIPTLLYLIRPTAVLGAILLTGYLGGAVATHVFVRHGWFQILFPVIFGIVLWLGVYLRDERLRALVPFRTPDRTR